MIKLDFGIYKGSTLLHNWWSVVKSHLTTLADAHNALETDMGQSFSTLREADTALEEKIKQAVSAEDTQRKAAYSQLTAGINTEKSARENADSAIERSINEQGTRLQEAIRGEADARLSGDNAINAKVLKLSEVSHTHDNLDVLSDVSEDDISSMREGLEVYEQNVLMLEYLKELCCGINSCVRELYVLSGVNFYDGGVEDEPDYGYNLDGGDLADTKFDSFDCGTFDSDILTS